MTTMELHPEVRLPLAPGRYRLEVKHEFGGAPPGASLPTRNHILEIDVPRASMSGTEVFSVTPPPNAVGPFAGRLAQIALRRRALPWARSGDTGPPWLALVLLSDGEGELRPDVPIRDAYSDDVYDALDEPPSADTRADCLAVVQSVVDRVFPAESELKLTSHVRQVDAANTEYADEDGWVSVVIANRLPQPGQRYRAYLISVEGQHESLPAPGRVATKPKLTWALADKVAEFVVANGVDTVSAPVAALLLEHAGSSGVDLGAVEASLRSLVESSGDGGLAGDGMMVDARGDLTHGEATTPIDLGDRATARARNAADATSSAITVAHAAHGRLAVTSVAAEIWAAVIAETEYRFPVLAHWEFECSDDGRDFSGYMSRLDVGMIGSTSQNRFERQTDEQKPDGARGERPSTETSGRRPVVAPTGHIQLTHTERGGQAAHSWYRGPLAPSKITRQPAGTPAHAADQLRALTEDGRWDTSYAAAFEIGRLLAMSDLQFLRSLRAYARAGFVTRRRRELFIDEASNLLGVDLEIDRLAKFDTELRTIIDRAFVPGGLGGDPRELIGDPLHVQSGPVVQPASEIEALANGFALTATELETMLATGPTTVVAEPGISPHRSFEELLAGGATVGAGLEHELAVNERLTGVRNAVESAGGVDAATERLRDLLGGTP